MQHRALSLSGLLGPTRPPRTSLWKSVFPTLTGPTSKSLQGPPELFSWKDTNQSKGVVGIHYIQCYKDFMMILQEFSYESRALADPAGASMGRLLARAFLSFDRFLVHMVGGAC